MKKKNTKIHQKKYFNAKNEKVLVKESDIRLLEIVLALISALEFRVPPAVGHSEHVARYAYEIGKKLQLKKDKLTILKYAGLLHDIGNIGVDHNILNKFGKLTAEEFAQVKKHPSIAKSILNPIKGLKEIIPIINHHHERYDGTGYPDGLKGKNIPLEARILNIADTFDAVSSNRPYRVKLSFEKARQILIDEKGKQMDPELVDVFLGIIDLKNKR